MIETPCFRWTKCTFIFGLCWFCFSLIAVRCFAIPNCPGIKVRREKEKNEKWRCNWNIEAVAALFHQCNRWWIRWLIGAHLTVWNAAATAAALDGMRWIIVVDFHVFTYHNTRFMSQWPFNGRLLVQCGGKSVDLSLPFFFYTVLNFFFSSFILCIVR